MDRKRPYKVYVEKLEGASKRTKPPAIPECTICDKKFTRRHGYNEHLKTEGHKRKVADADMDDEMTDAGGNLSTGDADEQPADNPEDNAAMDITVEELHDGGSGDEGDDLAEMHSSGNGDDDNDLAGLRTSFVRRFRQIMERNVDSDTIANFAADDFDMAEETLTTGNAHPFPNLQTLLFHALIYGDDDLVSRRIMQKVLYLVGVLMKLFAKSQGEFKLPKLDTLYNFDKRKSNKIPALTTTKVSVNGPNPKSYHLILPSTYLKLLVADPIRCKGISALPDYTPNQLVSLQQGQKWRTDPLSQQPVLSVNGQDFWIGDLFSAGTVGTRRCYLLESYFSKSGVTFGRCYLVGDFLDRDGTRHYFIEVGSCDIPVSSFHEVVAKERLPLDAFMSQSEGVFMNLVDRHKSPLFAEPHRMKKQILGDDGASTGRFYKVKIVPVALFSDDTSGNSSKQYNKYDSWSMVCAALSFEDRNRRENTYFLGAVSGSESLSAVDMVPQIAADLKELEGDKVMYSAEHGEDVLVTAPILFITADNPRHAELVGLLHSTTLFPCRFCYFRKLDRNAPGYNPELLNKRYLERTRDHYCLAATTLDRSTMIPDVLENPIKASDLSYRTKGADDLLKLKSFDPSIDTPVEILHSILLGVADYLVQHLVKIVMKNRKSSMQRLTDGLTKNARGPGFSRHFRRNLNHCGSFLGRDFKALIQILPLVISRDFTRPEDTEIRRLNRTFVKLGILSSLVFVRSVHGNIGNYIAWVDLAVNELTTALDEYDTAHSGPPTTFALKPKVHILHHLPANIARFGPPLHYETEKGEQFNKFIRERIVNTNRQSVSRDIAISFGKQAMLRHIVNGGSWTNDDGNRDQHNDEVAAFINEERADIFPLLFGGSREYQDNNDTSPRLIDGSCGVFMIQRNENIGPSTVRYIIGKAQRRDRGMAVREYRWIGRDEDGNPMVHSTDTWHSQNDLVLVGLLDIDDRITHCVVNQYKFGSYWMLNTL
ncbi:hypothetical protein [Absidia glauca]|uniref:C2H2-type domain-containing protein n=1 Tax=Absidia glauca TaxID=4829 RepID=A0A168KMZ2_ABSGL|nr:hypothetical protein [Absidia glauca]